MDQLFGNTEQDQDQTTVELIANLSDYRKLKAQADKLAEQMNTLKVVIREEVEAVGGKYQDDHGYARVVTRAGSVSYPGEQVDQLVRTWCRSDNDIIKSCGQMLMPMRRTSEGSEYIQIK